MSSSINIYDSIIRGNEASRSGSAIYFVNTQEVTSVVSNTTITENYVAESGTIYSFYSRVDFDSVTLTSNYADTDSPGMVLI